MGSTSKYGLPFPDGTGMITDGDDVIQQLAEDVDGLMATDDHGLLSARPVSSSGTPGKAGRLYTDEYGTTWRDYGTGWYPIGGKMPRLHFRGNDSAATSTDENVAWTVALDALTPHFTVSGATITVIYAGLYLVELSPRWASSSVGERRMVILSNDLPVRHSHVPGMAITPYWPPTLPLTLKLETGSSVGGRLWQNSGGDLDYEAEIAITMLSA